MKERRNCSLCHKAAVGPVKTAISLHPEQMSEMQVYTTTIHMTTLFGE